MVINITNELGLCDLVKDPQQMRSVYNDLAYSQTVTELKAELTRLRAQFQDTGGTPGAGKAASGGEEEAPKKAG